MAVTATSEDTFSTWRGMSTKNELIFVPSAEGAGFTTKFPAHCSDFADLFIHRSSDEGRLWGALRFMTLYGPYNVNSTQRVGWGEYRGGGEGVLAKEGVVNESVDRRVDYSSTHFFNGIDFGFRESEGDPKIKSFPLGLIFLASRPLVNI